jgi:hypothetical protein
MLGGGLRREERQLSRARVCVDLVGAFDDMSKGVFACLSPPTPAQLEPHISVGQACPAQEAHVDQLG